MKHPNCGHKVSGEGSHKYAAGSPECGELLMVGDWMARLAESTVIPRALPSPGLLLFKAKIRERLSSTDRAFRPIIAMRIAALLLLTASMMGVVFGTNTRIGAIFLESAALVGSFGPVLAICGVVTVVLCAAVAYAWNRSDG